MEIILSSGMTTLMVTSQVFKEPLQKLLILEKRTVDIYQGRFPFLVITE